MAEKVRDLRSALERLKNMPGQLAETDVEVDPMAELAGVYRYVGAGGTVKFWEEKEKISDIIRIAGMKENGFNSAITIRFIKYLQ